MTVPEKSQPMTFEGGSDIEACLSERFLSALMGLEVEMQTVGWIQGGVGHFHENLVGCGGFDGNCREGGGAKKACHEGIHCCACHAC